MKAPVAEGRGTSLGVRPARYQNISWSLDGTKLVVSEQRMEADGYRAGLPFPLARRGAWR